MKPNWGRTVGIAATLALVGGTTASAQITRIDIKVVESPTLDGRRFRADRRIRAPARSRLRRG